ncbi:zinc finger protein, partial [Aphelenchoides avenae]
FLPGLHGEVPLPTRLLLPPLQGPEDAGGGCRRMRLPEDSSREHRDAARRHHRVRLLQVARGFVPLRELHGLLRGEADRLSAGLRGHDVRLLQAQQREGPGEQEVLGHGDLRERDGVQRRQPRCGADRYEG